MRRPTILPLLALLAALGCQSTTPKVVATDPQARQALLEPVKSLAGSWRCVGPDGQPLTCEFQLTANGSAVRELMFAGTDYEMTNMYTLDGNSLVMTHYCASGNQPRMRADEVEGGRMVFRSDGVGDLKAADETYMGEMTLVLVDGDHVEQHWKSTNAPEGMHDVVIELERVR